MPQGDRTGPDGLGPRTGRGLGYCSGYESPGFMNGFGRGRGFGRGLGRRSRGFVSQPVVITEKEEKQYLEQELKLLREEVKEIEKRLKEIK